MCTIFVSFDVVLIFETDSCPCITCFPSPLGVMHVVTACLESITFVRKMDFNLGHDYDNQYFHVQSPFLLYSGMEIKLSPEELKFRDNRVVSRKHPSLQGKLRSGYSDSHPFLV